VSGAQLRRALWLDLQPDTALIWHTFRQQSRCGAICIGALLQGAYPARHREVRAGSWHWRLFPVLGQENNDLQNAIEQATVRLQQELGGQLPEKIITTQVDAALDELRDARVKTFIPVLTYRIARERLRRLLGDQN
jgi:hypothetical protein